MTVQSLSAVIRQVVAIAAIVMGALTAAVSGIHLPAAVSAVLISAGSAIMAIEHYVGDPSTGSTPPPAAAPLPAVPTAPAPPPTTPAVPG